MGGDVAFLVKVVVRAVVLRGRAAERIISGSVHQMTAGVHIACQNVCHGIQTVGSRQTRVKHGVDILVVFYPAGFHNAGAVDQNHNILEVLVQIVDYAQLNGIRFQIAFGLILQNVRMVIHGARHIASFTNYAAQHKNGRCVRKGVGQTRLAGDNINGALVQAEILRCTKVYRTGTAGVRFSVAHAVEVPQGIVYRESTALQGAFQ